MNVQEGLPIQKNKVELPAKSCSGAFLLGAAMENFEINKFH
jgi:hypothetical protein